MKKLAFALALFVAAGALFAFGCGKKQSGRSLYEIECAYENGVLEGSMDFTFYNDFPTAVKELKFNLFPNAYREGAKYPAVSASAAAGAYYAGKSYGSIEISAVRDEEGETEFSVGGADENVLTVPLEREVFPEERYFLSVDFTVKLAKIDHRLGIAKNAVNLGNFYPVLCGWDGGFYECVYYSSGDPFFSDCADYEVTFTAGENYVTAASGELKKSVTENGKTTNVYTFENARDFALCLSEKFETMSAKAGDVTVNYYYIDDDAPLKSMQYALKAVETFSSLFGKYPYRSLSVAETGFNEGGMEYPALVFISERLEDAAFGEVIVHETAHQWWYAGVGNNEVEYGFLDEGLAEYSTVLFYEKNEGFGMTRPQMIEAAELTYHTFCNVYDKLFGKVDTSMLRPLGEYSGEYEYVNIAYIKACLMYETLRETVGDKMFFKGLSEYYETYLYEEAEPQDLVGVYEKCGADTNGFFESFFDGSAIL